MPQLGFIIDGETYSLEEALQASRDRQIPYPVSLLRASFNTRVSQVPSPSSLADCLRAFELKRTEGYYRTVESYLPAMFGISVHDFLERQEQQGHLEHSMSTVIEFPDLPAPYNRLTVSGRSDHIDIEGQRISDYKTKVHLPKTGFSPASKHIIQLNVYNWLWSLQGNPALKYYTLYYMSQTNYRMVEGELSEPEKVGEWVKQRLYQWAAPVARGELPLPLASVYETNKKNQGPCAYCEVFSQCRARLDLEAEEPDEAPLFDEQY